MIIQGTNAPIVFTFAETMADILDIEISLYHAESKAEIKHWTLQDVDIQSNIISAPLTQEETINFPAGKCILEIKWMDTNGRTNFAKNIQNVIVERYDKTVMEGD